MYDFPMFSSIKEGLIFIAVLSVILIIALLCEYRRKQLEKKQQDLKDLISDAKTPTKHKY